MPSQCLRRVSAAVGLFVQAFVPMVSGFGHFDPIRCILMISCVFVVISIAFPMLCASVHSLDPSVWSAMPFGLSERCFAVAIGESGGFDFF